jgi:NAD(P)H dehydrogenase (quinone)
MILVTGASGQLATLVANGARQAGLQIATGSRLSGADRRLDFDRPDTLDFSGIDTLFMISAGYAEDDVVMRRHGAVLAAARAQKVRHVIYTSLSSASDHLGFALAHRWTEKAVRESGLAWTILRNGLYAELIGALATPRDGRVTAPFGDRGISAVARADLAAAAVAVLEDPAAHAGKSYELSGPVAFTVPDLARRLDVSYAPDSLEVARARLGAQPLLPFQAPMIMSIYSAAMAGFLEAEGGDLETLVPRPKDALAVAETVARGAR